MSAGSARFPCQDAALPVEQRADDLFSRMELEDKAGLMFQPMSAVGIPAFRFGHGLRYS